MIRAPGIFRSILFWSGILVMVFICWAWWHSESRWRSVYYRNWYVVHGGAAVQVVSMPNVSFGWGSELYPIPREEVFEAFPRPQFQESRGSMIFSSELPKGGTVRESFMRKAEMVGYGAIFIPHWLILLAFALPWSGLLVWRACWRRRKNVV